MFIYKMLCISISVLNKFKSERIYLKGFFKYGSNSFYISLKKIVHF